MIRFCEKEAVIEDDLIRKIILDEKVVFDINIWENAKNIFANKVAIAGGRVLFPVRDKMLQGVCYDVLSTEGAVLDSGVWENAEDFFSRNSEEIIPQVLLPIVNENGEFICYAYEDFDANREVRMLRELLEEPNALEFLDVFPEYKYVKICGFNELAFLFAEYLERKGVAVVTDDVMWSVFSCGIDCCVLEQGEGLIIQAEGDSKNKKFAERLLKSVSVEFECIDRIYECNIQKGIMKDTYVDSHELLRRLKQNEEIIILGSGRAACDAYDFLIKHGIDICCFVDERAERQLQKIFGKQILSAIDVRALYRDAVFLECESRNSAWGCGGTDYYDYIGYIRNERFFLLKDYVDVWDNSMTNILKSKKVVLTGDAYMCACLFNFFKNKKVHIIGYLEEPSQKDIFQELPRFRINDINKEITYLIAFPEFFGAQMQKEQSERKRQWINYLKCHGVNDYTDYFCGIASFTKVMGEGQKYKRGWLMPKRIILGSIEHHCGNVFFKELLDGHPSILLETDWRFLDDKLFWCSIFVSTQKGKNILLLFKKIYKDWGGNLYNTELFDRKMMQLLSEDERYTSQEIFVMIHMAYMYMYGVNVDDVSGMLIYWEPHNIPRESLEECVNWLGESRVACDIVNVVRNICMRNGSMIKGKLEMGCNAGLDSTAFRYLFMSYPSIDKKRFERSSRYVLRFEDLKCNAEELLMKLCDLWGIVWSDTMLHTSCKENTKYVEGWSKGFDLKPVYNSYEEYFSEFDRFRMMLINAPYQKEYGYPYVEVLNFSRKELYEMFLSAFYFERNIVYQGAKLNYDLKIQRQLRQNIQNLRKLAFIGTRTEKDW